MQPKSVEILKVERINHHLQDNYIFLVLPCIVTAAWISP